jgi:hypothetical protein
MAAALIDRLVHHCQIVNFRSDSVRMRLHSELSKSRLASDHEPKPTPRKRRTGRAQDFETGGQQGGKPQSMSPGPSVEPGLQVSLCPQVV